MTEIVVVRLNRVELFVHPKKWLWAEINKTAIDEHFVRVRACNPDRDLWDGKILLLDRFELTNGIFRGDIFTTNYASFLCWRDQGAPDKSVASCVGMGALVSADGAYILGIMSKHTAQPGSIYFPAGLPDPRDVRTDGSLDILGSALRELEEETGLARTSVTPSGPWHAVLAGPFITFAIMLRSPDSADDIRLHIHSHILKKARPELAGVFILRNASEFLPQMPAFLTTYFERVLSVRRQDHRSM